MKTINGILDFAKGNEPKKPACLVVIGFDHGQPQIKIENVVHGEIDIICLDCNELTPDEITILEKTDFTAEIEAAKRKKFERL